MIESAELSEWSKWEFSEKMGDVCAFDSISRMRNVYELYHVSRQCSSIRAGDSEI